MRRRERRDARFDYRWHLRAVMASRGMYATTDLRPLLAERGFQLSQSQVYRLVAQRPERLRADPRASCPNEWSRLGEAGS
ncbi:Cro/C1-type helix-turn-helix DNA-binding protein [Nonomuraea polychroma]|uniref:Cro/C1-type helix-turn-helix DNA-binding protein n=1 Tax=Nonomuraea polychroma TaxID=46176 RepID=A0A438MKY4_9ACTN|nr:helix-turn-helix domain-containing protein [Nonomuraea polychroma]RVX46400.1 Cro/C1-type helix-turn-helix DNA-binding protein [Nonomuraea polychroma]